MTKQSRFTKIGAAGEPLAADAREWEAALDNTTGLMWTKEDVEVGHWREADAAAKGMKAGGFDDWRLPSVEELFLLADRTRETHPAIDVDFFPDCKSRWYWSSTPYAPSPGDCAWGVNFYGGSASWFDRDDDGFVRAVRAGQ